MLVAFRTTGLCPCTYPGMHSFGDHLGLLHVIRYHVVLFVPLFFFPCSGRQHCWGACLGLLPLLRVIRLLARRNFILRAKLSWLRTRVPPRRARSSAAGPVEKTCGRQRGRYLDRWCGALIRLHCPVSKCLLGEVRRVDRSGEAAWWRVRESEGFFPCRAN